jgi:transposase
LEFELWTDIKVNILPIARPQLSPIELIWNWTKVYVKSNKHDFSKRSVEKSIKKEKKELQSLVENGGGRHAKDLISLHWGTKKLMR